tara:strand:- start:447 stop:839 length:393 start_codon:yes stop_codon:yes gene_type:complete
MEKSISNKILREFGVLVGIGLPILVGWILPVLWGHSFRYWTLWIGLPLLFIATFRPSFLYYPYKLWIKLGHVLGWVNSKVILGLVFLFVLQPIAVIMKSFGYDPLRKKKTNKTTYREIRSNLKIDLRKIF